MNTAATLGRLGLPAPVEDLARRTWDVLIVGAGHNGLACAAYLAKAGLDVLVLEARERVGGACTLEEPWPGYRVSPCAYLAGLVHPLVLEELDLAGRGFRWFEAEAGLFVPFDDGESVQLWNDDARCEAEIRRLAPADLDGWRALQEAKRRLRQALRPADGDDLWIGPPPSRQQLEERLGDDAVGRRILFEWSMDAFLSHFLSDRRLKQALLGQGVIGTNASPFDPGTASIHFHHASGRMQGQAGAWGYVEGGMGMVSFLLCDAAREAGATIACGLPVGAIVPGQGVELADGQRLDAHRVVCNADPQVTTRLLGQAAPPDWVQNLEAIPRQGCTVKLNIALKRLPSFCARPGRNQDLHRGQVNTPLDASEWPTAHQSALQGRLPPRLWTELYFPTARDPSVAPPGRHLMSIFAQYVPYRFAKGDWDSRRLEVQELALATVGRFCHDLEADVEAVDVLGPPDIEARVGLSGGHIFQGECLPEYMWDRRLDHRTPVPGLYLCGACTHPGGSVIAVNGRNAAMAVLADSGALRP